MIRVRTNQNHILYLNEQTIRELFDGIGNAPEHAGEIVMESPYCGVVVKIRLGESETVGYRITSSTANKVLESENQSLKPD